MSREAVVSTIQMPMEYRRKLYTASKEEQLKSALAMFNDAGKAGADIAVAGEKCNILFCNIKNTGQHMRLADRVPGPAVRKFQSIAGKYGMYIILPLGAVIEGKLRNTALVIDRAGKIIGRYDKVHCTRGERETGIVPGDDFPVFDLDVGRIGIMICHDNSFVESARVLALKGAEIIFWPHIQGGWGEVMWNAVLASRAIDNCCYIVSSSFGLEKNRKAWRPGMAQGRSCIIRWDGHVIADCGRWVGIASAAIDLDHIRTAHDFTTAGDHPFRKDLMSDRRPECYEAIVTPTEKLPGPSKKLKGREKPDKR